MPFFLLEILEVVSFAIHRKSDTSWTAFLIVCSGRREGQGCSHDKECGDRMECTGLLGNQTCRCVTPYLLNADGSCGEFPPPISLGSCGSDGR